MVKIQVIHYSILSQSLTRAVFLKHVKSTVGKLSSSSLGECLRPSLVLCSNQQLGKQSRAWWETLRTAKKRCVFSSAQVSGPGEVVHLRAAKEVNRVSCVGEMGIATSPSRNKAAAKISF